MHKESAEKQQQNMVIELSDGRKKFNPKDPFCHRKTVLHDIKCLVHQMSFSSEPAELAGKLMYKAVSQQAVVC